MKFSFWHWPDHLIGKRESRRLREEHNAALNVAHELLQECKHSLAEYSALPESRLSQLDRDRIASLKAVIAKAGVDLDSPAIPIGAIMAEANQEQQASLNRERERLQTPIQKGVALHNPRNPAYACNQCGARWWTAGGCVCGGSFIIT